MTYVQGCEEVRCRAMILSTLIILLDETDVSCHWMHPGFRVQISNTQANVRYS